LVRDEDLVFIFLQSCELDHGALHVTFEIYGKKYFVHRPANAAMYATATATGTVPMAGAEGGEDK
jgi:hypothetical protein